MRILDTDTDRAVVSAQMYLSPNEARELVEALQQLLANPEANAHDHLFSEKGGCEMSFSIVTEAKLANVESYTSREQRLLKHGK